MTRNRPPRFWRVMRMIARRTSGHAFTVLHYVFNLLLLAIALVLGYLLLRRELPVPAFLHGAIQRELGARGFAASFASAQFDPAGRIYVEDLELTPVRFGEPVLAVKRVLIELNRLQLLAGQVELTRVEAEELRVICPARISPSGLPETLVNVATARVTHRNGHWVVPGLVATIGSLQVTAHGEYIAPEDRPPAPRPDIDALLDRFAVYAPRHARSVSHLTGIEQPRIEVSFNGRAGEPLEVAAVVSAAKWHDARVGELQGVRLRGRTRIGGEETATMGPEPLRLQARIDSFDRPQMLQAKRIDIEAEWLGLPTTQHPWPWQVHVAASEVVHSKATIDTPVLAIWPLAFPLLDVQASVVFEDQPIDVWVQGDVKSRQLDAWIHGRAGATWLARASEIIGRDVTYYATIDEPPDFAASVSFDDGLKWREAEFRLDSGPIVARGVALDRTRVQGRVNPAGVRLSWLEFSRGDDERVRGTYADTFATRDYQFRLTGSARPLGIAPWFGPWWANFWKDFSFEGDVPIFDVDAQGNWLKPDPVIVSGSGGANRVSFRGFPFESTHTAFLIRPNYFDLFDAALVRTEGRIDGEVQLRYQRGDPNPLRQTFRFTSTADLVDLARLFGSGGEELLEPYRYTVPPMVTVEGAVSRESGRYDTQLLLGIETTNEFRYHDFPLQAVSTEVQIHNRRVVLPRLSARYANGTVTGTAIADEGRLTFDATLADADYDLAVETFTAFLDRNFPSPPEENEPTGFASRKLGGKLELALTAAGPITDFKAYEGRGQVRIHDADIGQIKVLGLLSDLFGSVGIKIGTLDFHEANSALEVRRDSLVFPNLRITGNTAAVEANGAYSLRDRSIDFRAQLHPLRESSGALTQLFSLMLGPFSNLLELRLTGTLREPQWMFVRGPTAILRALSGTPEQVPVDPAAPSPPPPLPTDQTPADQVPEETPSEPAPTPSPAADSTPVPAP